MQFVIAVIQFQTLYKIVSPKEQDFIFSNLMLILQIFRHLFLVQAYVTCTMHNIIQSYYIRLFLAGSIKNAPLETGLYSLEQLFKAYFSMINL